MVSRGILVLMVLAYDTDINVILACDIIETINLSVARGIKYMRVFLLKISNVGDTPTSLNEGYKMKTWAIMCDTDIVTGKG